MPHQWITQKRSRVCVTSTVLSLHLLLLALPHKHIWCEEQPQKLYKSIKSTGFSQQLTVKGPCCFDGILPESHSFCLTPAVISFLYYYFFFFLAVDKATDYQNYYQGLWDCTGDQTDELTFKRGDPIYILSKVCLSFCLKVYLQNSLECKVKINKIIQNKFNSPTIINSNCSR